MLREVCIHELKESVERERLRVQREGGKDRVRSLWGWGRGSGGKMKALNWSQKGNPQPSGIRGTPELAE